MSADSTDGTVSTEQRTIFDNDAFLWDLAQALLRARARRRARLAVEDPDALARELAEDAAWERDEMP